MYNCTVTWRTALSEVQLTLYIIYSHLNKIHPTDFEKVYHAI